jgi:hypothetical protein
LDKYGNGSGAINIDWDGTYTFDLGWWYRAGGYTSLPDPLDAGFDEFGVNFSFYATYTPSGIHIGDTSSVAVGSWTNSMTIPAPSGIEDDDILVLTFYRYGTYGGVTVPTGFSEPVVGALSSDTIRVCWKRASSESGNYTITDSAGNISVASITVVKGCKNYDSPSM